MLYRIIFSLFGTLILLGLSTQTLLGQGDPIPLQNPSFNDVPHAGSLDSPRGPLGWYDCGAQGETPPDVQPNLDPFGEKFFKVSLKAYHKDTYMGMVVRDNDTQEAVGQRLATPLEAGQCYEMSMYLARSEVYVSSSRTDATMREVNFTRPIKIRVYGGNGYCRKTELLDETELIKNTNWRKYNLRFEPTATHRFILIQAFYQTPTLFPYNGNVLVDNLSDITPVPCDQDEPPKEENMLASVDKIPNNKVETTPIPKVETPKKEVNKPQPKEVNPTSKMETPNEEKIIRSLDNKRIRKGQIIQIDKLFFKMDDASIGADSYQVLEEISAFLIENKKVQVEVRGHTNNRCDAAFCNQLSTKRAKAVADYLVKKGVDSERVTSKGYGKTKPVASNRYAAGRKKNQRVEIKIVKM